MAALASNTSSDLVWEVVKNNHCFLFKPRGFSQRFSKERFNLSKTNCKVTSGFISSNAVDVSTNSDGQIVIASRDSNQALHPSKSINVETHPRSRRAARVAGGAIKKHKSYLQKTAELRTAQLLASLKPVKTRKAPAAAAKTEV